ncbi:hypothetical protein [Afifella sp. IM 167]|nr:hypothetical protein [Afifella sp. IM 167]
MPGALQLLLALSVVIAILSAMPSQGLASMIRMARERRNGGDR